ncbi:hypothetical protein A2U01_0003017 [Trifolium medium]|uniref:Uncharacterized protein n=1 Tax=Trifolium medium TaxID=97028 RepID=A0A392M490_9FABA|nr:hypothetical protein [Trifolium medium]
MKGNSVILDDEERLCDSLLGDQDQIREIESVEMLRRENEKLGLRSGNMRENEWPMHFFTHSVNNRD